MARNKEDFFLKSELLSRGWSERLIARYLDPPDDVAMNRMHIGGPALRRYRKQRVLQREEELAVQLAMGETQRRGERIREGRQRVRERDFSSFKDYFPLALALERRFIFYCGPTNSGKTYQALNELCRHESGAYLAPLRLLALEGQQEIEQRGRPCSLVTGDEREIKPLARFTAQTIESLSYDREVEAILIDEVQMVLNDQRGDQWVSALIGAPASTIYLAGSPEALAAVQQLCQYVGSPLELRPTERLSPLEVDSKKRSLDDALEAPGKSAFIVFSRRDVFDLKDAIEEQGQRAAVIYGSLGPVVRRAEAQRFRGGECRLLIATDAIGMGLNLPIDQLYFLRTAKFDGTQERPLTPLELRQIGGRAGRYTKSESGLVGGMFEANMHAIRAALEAPPASPPQRPLPLAIPLAMAREFAQLRKTDSLSKVLQFFAVMKDRSNLFKPAVQPQVLWLAGMLDRYPGLSFELRYRLSFAPVESNDAWLLQEFRDRVADLAEGRELDFFESRRELQQASATLQGAERVAKLYTLQLWFALQFSDAEQVRELEHERGLANAAIEGFLRARARDQRRRCRSCERQLPRFSPYGLCESCYRLARY